MNKKHLRNTAYIASGAIVVTGVAGHVVPGFVSDSVTSQDTSRTIANALGGDYCAMNAADAAIMQNENRDAFVGCAGFFE